MTRYARDNWPLASALLAVLKDHAAVEQLQALELVTALSALRMGNRRDAVMVADGMHKHIKQLIALAPQDGPREAHVSYN